MLKFWLKKCALYVGIYSACTRSLRLPHSEKEQNTPQGHLVCILEIETLFCRTVHSELNQRRQDANPQAIAKSPENIPRAI